MLFLFLLHPIFNIRYLVFCEFYAALILFQERARYTLSNAKIKQLIKTINNSEKEIKLTKKYKNVKLTVIKEMLTETVMRCIFTYQIRTLLLIVLNLEGSTLRLAPTYTAIGRQVGTRCS